MAERILALDYGERRIGIAVSDGLGITAQPYAVIAAEEVRTKLPDIIAELGVVQLVVGLPISLSGAEGATARRARAFAADVAEISGLPVELVDERFTSTEAERVLLESGARRARRREVRDKLAATVLLQGYLDRST